MQKRFKMWLPNLGKMTNSFSFNEIPFLFCEGVPDSGIVLQYTGIKDRNANEIYEGYIVIDCMTGAIGEIKFGFCEKLGFTGWYYFGLNIDNYFLPINIDLRYNANIRIIGNKYENPELLKN